LAVEERDSELEMTVLTEPEVLLIELDRDEEAAELVEDDRENEDDTEVDTAAEVEGVMMVPLTFLGIANAPLSPDDR